MMAKTTMTYDLLKKCLSLRDHGYSPMEVSELTCVGYSTILRYLSVADAIKEGKPVEFDVRKTVNMDAVFQWAKDNNLTVNYQSDKPQETEEKHTDSRTVDILNTITELLISLDCKADDLLNLLRKYLEV